MFGGAMNKFPNIACRNCCQVCRHSFEDAQRSRNSKAWWSSSHVGAGMSIMLATYVDASARRLEHSIWHAHPIPACLVSCTLFFLEA